MHTPARLTIGGAIAVLIGIVGQFGNAWTIVLGGWLAVIGCAVLLFGIVAWAVRVGIRSAGGSDRG